MPGDANLGITKALPSGGALQLVFMVSIGRVYAPKFDSMSFPSEAAALQDV